MAEVKKLTRPQAEALKRVWTQGSGAWCWGSRAGGATARMFNAMAKRGLCSTPPYKITPAGKKAVAAFEKGDPDTVCRRYDNAMTYLS